ncbi:MAG: HDOD domain-containing protein [Calditrichia bacterium]
MNRTDYYLKELEGINEVPTLPHIAFKLIALISDDNSSMRAIGDLIEDDPPLVAKILRIVNSGFYNIRNEVKSVRQAVVLLGLEELKNLVFAMSVFSTFYHIKENEYFNFIQFWKHSASTSKVAAVLAKYLGFDFKHISFVGGLLHDFGRLVLQLYFQEDYQEVFEYALENKIGLYQAEKESMGFSHDEAGYWLAQKWHLPDELSTIMRYHHRITENDVENEPLLAIIHAADRITNIWGVGIEPLPVMAPLEENPIWIKMLNVYPKLQKFPLMEMTRVFDMHLEEAEMFVNQISRLHEIADGEK